MADEIGYASIILPYFYSNLGDASFIVNLEEVEIEASGYGSSTASISFDYLTNQAIGINGRIGTLSETLQSIILEAGNAELANASLQFLAPTTIGAGYTGNVGTASIPIADLYGISLLIDASMLSECTGSLVLQPLYGFGNLLFGSGGVAENSLSVRLDAIGHTGEIGTVSVSYEELTLSSAIMGSYLGQAAIVFPLLSTDGNEQPRQVVSGVFDVYALNTENFGVTTFSNYDFNSFANFNNSYIAASSSGLFLLSGNTDYGEQINMEITKKQFGGDVRNNKRFRDVFIATETDGPVEVELQVDNETYVYQKDPYYDLDSELQTVRIKPGKGLWGRYLKMTLRNRGGGYLYLEDISLDIDVKERSGGL